MAVTSTLKSLLQSHPSILFVAFRWVDYCGHLRARMLTKEYALRLESTNETISSGLVHMTVLPDNTQLQGHQATAVEYFTPDWKSATTFSYDNEHMYIAVACNIVEQLPNQPRSDSRCPRAALRNTLDALGHLNILVGFEIEFNIINNTNDDNSYVAEETFGYSSASVFRTNTFRVVQDCVIQLRRNNVTVNAFHAEGCGNQFEISTGPFPPIEAVDVLVQTLDIIRGVTARHGHRATMYPKPQGQKAWNGLHANFSFNPVIDEPAFIAGIMNRLPVLLAFSMPSQDSYKRLSKGVCGTWVAWGTQNRDCPLRKIYPGRWEIRCFDATANPYLALAAYFAAGALGVRSGEVLELSDCDQWISDMNAQDVAQGWGIDTPLPNSLKASLGSLKDDPMQLDEYLGKDLIARYVQLKNFQIEHFEKIGVSETTALCTKAY